MVKVKDAKIRAQYERVYKSFVASAERHYYRGTPQGRAAARKIAGMVKNSNPKAYKFIITMVDFGTPDHFELIAKFIRERMIYNTFSREAERIREQISFSLSDIFSTPEPELFPRGEFKFDIPGAFLEFKNLVKDGGDWDFKSHWHPSQKRGGRPGVKIWDPKRPKSGHLRYHYDPKTDTSYRQDLWSNISFGFTGRALGFSRQVLTGGSGLYSLRKEDSFYDAVQKIGDLIVTGDLSKLDADASDIAGMRIGYDLFESHGDNVSTAMLLNAVRSSKGKLDTKAGRQ